MTARGEFLNGLIGKPWVANARGPDAWDCYFLVQHIEVTLFGRPAQFMPDVNVPTGLSVPQLIRIIDRHPARALWTEVKYRPPIPPQDGAVVLLAHVEHPAHFGVWLAPERGIIHVDRPNGVALEDMATLRAIGWRRMIFYEPGA